MTLGELESIALRIPVLEERFTSLEAKLEEMVAKPTVPEFVSRPELARISGISQNTIRRREYQAELPKQYGKLYPTYTVGVVERRKPDSGVAAPPPDPHDAPVGNLASTTGRSRGDFDDDIPF